MTYQSSLKTCWYLYKDDQKIGPFTVQKLVTLYYEGKVKNRDLCESTESREIQSLFKILNSISLELTASVRSPHF